MQSRGVEIFQNIAPGHAALGKADIVRGAPVITRSRPPVPGISHAPFANPEGHGMAGAGGSRSNRVANLRVLRRGCEAQCHATAPVYLDIIKAPFLKLQHILGIMAVAALVCAAAPVRARVGVNTCLESQTVNIARYARHAIWPLA